MLTFDITVEASSESGDIILDLRHKTLCLSSKRLRCVRRALNFRPTFTEVRVKIPKTRQIAKVINDPNIIDELWNFVWLVSVSLIDDLRSITWVSLINDLRSTWVTSSITLIDDFRSISTWADMFSSRPLSLNMLRVIELIVNDADDGDKSDEDNWFPGKVVWDTR